MTVLRGRRLISSTITCIHRLQTITEILMKVFIVFCSRERVFLMVLLGEIGNTASSPHICINPIPAGAVHIRFLHFILAHYISVFKPVKDKK